MILRFKACALDHAHDWPMAFDELRIVGDVAGPELRPAGISPQEQVAAGRPAGLRQVEVARGTVSRVSRSSPGSLDGVGDGDGQEGCALGLGRGEDGVDLLARHARACRVVNRHEPRSQVRGSPTPWRSSRIAPPHHQ